MPKLTIIQTSRFKKDLKPFQHDKKLRTELTDCVEMLQAGIPLPPKYKDHYLSGNYEGKRDCHIRPNIVLIYQVTATDLILIRLGSHNKLGLTECNLKNFKLHITESNCGGL